MLCKCHLSACSKGGYVTFQVVRLMGLDPDLHAREGDGEGAGGADEGLGRGGGTIVVLGLARAPAFLVALNCSST